MSHVKFKNQVTFCLVVLASSGCGGRTNNSDYGANRQLSGGEDSGVDLGGTSSGGMTKTSFGKGGYSTVATSGTSYGGAIVYYSGGYGGKGGSNWTGGVTGKGGASTATKGGATGSGGTSSRGGTNAFGGTLAFGGTAIGGRSVGGATAIGGVAGHGNVAGGLVLSGGTAGTAGRRNVAGNAGIPPAYAGASGAAACSAIACTTTCASGLWRGPDGCLDCLCAPPPNAMTYDTLVCPADAIAATVSVSSASSQWVFDFAWSCGAPVAPVVKSIQGSLRARFTNNPSDSTILDPGLTLFQPSPIMSFIPITFDGPQLVLTLSGSSPSTVALTPTTSSFLSIRREGNRFVGGVYFVGTPGDTATATAILSAPFNVQVPGT